MDKTRKRTEKKAAYEKPRLEVVKLNPEEQLLACDKVTTPVPCTMGIIS
ncbi:MAG: hypothetical protein KKI08_18270 [Armatimonadetes bacterium]|nr:hypothetical protein [Armatimonadota bacterium]